MATGDKVVSLDGLKTAYDNTKAMLASTETSSTASTAHIPGTDSEFFIYGGKLCQATVSIAQGDTITPNTNCKEAPLGKSVSELKSALSHDLFGGDYQLTDINKAYINSSGEIYYRNYFHVKYIEAEKGIQYNVKITINSALTSSDYPRICYTETKPVLGGTAIILETIDGSVAGLHERNISLENDGYLCIAYFGATVSVGSKNIYNTVLDNESDIKELSSASVDVEDNVSLIKNRAIISASGRLGYGYVNGQNKIFLQSQYFAIDYYAVKKGIVYGIEMVATDGIQSDLNNITRVGYTSIVPAVGVDFLTLLNWEQPKAGKYNCTVLAPNDGYLAIAHYIIATTISAVYSCDMYENVSNRRTITVDAGGLGDYTSLVDALKSITDGFPTTVRVLEGTYTLSDDWTEEELNNADYPSGFCGTKVPVNVDIVGIGARENIIINNELISGYTWDDTWKHISTLNLMGNNTLENITVTGEGLRYAIHDDFSGSAYRTNRFINCIIKMIKRDNTPAVGSGTYDGETMIFERCIIDPVLAVHGNNSVYIEPKLFIKDTIINGYLSLGDYDMRKNFDVVIENSFINYVSYYRTAGSEQYIRVQMYGCEAPFVTSIEGITYVMDGVENVYSASNIAKGTPVKKTGPRTVAAMLSSDSEKLFCGIAMTAMSASDAETTGLQYAPIIKHGYVSNLITGLQNLSVGDLIGIDNGGLSVVQTGGIGIVEFVQSNIAYIKLF